jgi:hypothetical protein
MVTLLEGQIEFEVRGDVYHPVKLVELLPSADRV